MYLGDTARLPYGTKTRDSVVRYSVQCAGALVARGIRCLVVACNTAASSALTELRAQYRDIPVIGVIEPGAAAAVSVTRTRHVAVIGTEGTIGGGAYQRAIHALDPNVRVSATPCSLFVALAEEGWTSGAVAESIARRYLHPLFMAHGANGSPPDTLVLGCTHFPVLAASMAAVIPPGVHIVDSAASVATEVRRVMAQIAGGGAAAGRGAAPLARGSMTWLATDGAARFARVGGIFLGEELEAAQVEIIDL